MERLIFEKQRRQCWIDAWCAAASCFNMDKPEKAAKWADHALKDFDERFPATKEEYDNQKQN